MSSLFWAIRWDWGVYTLDSVAESAIAQAIRQRVEGHSMSPDDVGRYIAEVPVIIDGGQTSFTAQLERIDPPATFRVDTTTSFHIRLVRDFDNRVSVPGKDTALGLTPAQEIEDLIMFQVTFDPKQAASFYMELYESLVGIPKELILREMISLLAPVEKKEEWSKRHYGRLLPALRTTAGKAPVIVFGGDPGTGKTALATSIGAPLALALGERVHFRHASLLLRGMGYQGRASGMIVRLFEHIKQEYIELREPMIVFFDEAEAVVGSRRGTDSSSGAQENIAIVDAIIVGVDGLRKGLQARIVALFATNLTDRVDAALMRRSYYHYFDRPDDDTRRALFHSALQGMGFSASDVERLVDATRPRKIDEREVRFTPSDIVELIIGRALNEAMNRNKPLSIELILDYCKRTNPTGAISGGLSSR